VTTSLNILCVTPLPPHTGHRVRALSPITADALRCGDPFASRHPEIGVTRFTVPYFEVAPNLPANDDYRRTEREQIRTLLPALIRQERPDIILMGRETFAWDTPDIAAAHAIPCALRLAGATTFGILNRTLPDAEANRLLEQYRKTTLLISPAEHLARRVRHHGLHAATVIRNAVDLQRFAPRPKDANLLRALRIGAEDVVVAHVSNLKSLKRPLDIIGATDKTLRENPRLLYLIVGDGPTRALMEQTCRKRGMSERYRFVGWVDHDAVPDYINLADIVVLPSEDEAQARVYLETQACERVIVASDIPAAHEVIVDGETGVLFRMGDADDLAAKMADLARDPARRADIGKRARVSVARHALPVVVREYLDALAAAVQRHRHTHRQ
jgi:glycosyltransferase involved in cell wall biosynthesis